MKERGQGRPDEQSGGQKNAQLKEQGRSLSGFVNLQPEQKADKNQRANHYQTCGDVLERRVRLHARETAPRKAQEYNRREGEVIVLEEQIKEKGTDRERFILDLYTSITTEISSILPVPVGMRPLTLEEFQQFRAQIEPLSDEEIAKEVCKRKDIIEIARKEPIVVGAFHPGVGLGEIFRKDQKDKEE